jgi:diguanylate cyclase (GGDEF)-like protein
MKNLPFLNRKLRLAFGSTALALLVVGTISYRGLAVSSESVRWVRHTHEVIENIQDMRVAWETISSASRGFILTGNEFYFDEYRASVAKAEQERTIVRRLTVDNPIQQRQFPILDALFTEKVQRIELIAGLRRTRGLAAAAAALQSETDTRTAAEFEALATQLQDEELRLLVLRDAESSRRMRQVKTGLVLGGFLGLLIAGASCWSLQRGGAARELAERALNHSNDRLVKAADAAQAMTQLMTHSAEHDALTGLPNRLLLNDRLGQAIALAERHKGQIALLFLDLDGFKHINDSLGHSFGDKLLQSIAVRLATCVHAPDTASRHGGDEFVILLPEVRQPEDAAAVARRLLEALAKTYSIGRHVLHVTTSIGVSIYPGDGLDVEALIKNAETAMYQAKENGHDSYQFFRSAMNVRAVERQSIEEQLRHALERKELTLHYQPKINLDTGAITGAEALIRWIHPIRGLVSPDQFIPIAEDCGLILPIGDWVLREACAQARAWEDAGLPAITMAVNVSALQFRKPNFLEEVYSALIETDLDPRYLELELTEGALMMRAESTASILSTLRGVGVRVAVDDFGTGYSSLSYIRKFPLDALKIDQSFIRQITTIPDETTIVRAIISMARSLDLRVIAEGVETPDQLDFLKAHGCDEAQGYYFSQPVPAEQFATLLGAKTPVETGACFVGRTTLNLQVSPPTT